MCILKHETVNRLVKLLLCYLFVGADVEFINTESERSEKSTKDLAWFKEQGHGIPKSSVPGLSYSQYLKDLSEKDSQAFICHFYIVYVAHTAGGRMIGRKVCIDNSKC